MSRMTTTVLNNGVVVEEWREGGGALHRDALPAYIEFRGDGSLRLIRWYRHGEPHREGLAAALVYYPSGRLQGEQWFLDGQAYRPNGLPVLTEYREDGSIERRQWNERRTDGQSIPAHQAAFRFDGTLRGENWRVDGKLHREDGPAIREYRRNGSLKAEHWFREGNRFRVNGPGAVMYREDGSVSWECHTFRDGVWQDGQPSFIKRARDGHVTRHEWNEGNRHRVDGPAVIDYHSDGTVKRERWFIDGKRLPPELEEAASAMFHSAKKTATDTDLEELIRLL